MSSAAPTTPESTTIYVTVVGPRPGTRGFGSLAWNEGERQGRDNFEDRLIGGTYEFNDIALWRVDAPFALTDPGDHRTVEAIAEWVHDTWQHERVGTRIAHRPAATPEGAERA